MVIRFLVIEALTIIMGIVFGMIFPDVPDKKQKILAGFAYWLACQSVLLAL